MYPGLPPAEADFLHQAVIATQLLVALPEDAQEDVLAVLHVAALSAAGARDLRGEFLSVRPELPLTPHDIVFSLLKLARPALVVAVLPRIPQHLIFVDRLLTAVITSLLVG